MPTRMNAANISLEALCVYTSNLRVRNDPSEPVLQIPAYQSSTMILRLLYFCYLVSTAPLFLRAPRML